MKNHWSAAESEHYTARYRAQGFGADMALRVYTSRLLGREPALVLHGGGNTSVKTRVPDIAGDAVDELCVKGSGWDLAESEPAGLPAVAGGVVLGLCGGPVVLHGRTGGRRWKAANRLSANGALMMPRSVIKPLTSACGVTSNAGVRAAGRCGARR